MDAGSAGRNTIMSRVSKYYEKSGFTARYGLDVWLVGTVCAIFVVNIAYWQVKNHLVPIRANWLQNRCNPAYMPFAGTIMPVPGQTAAETAGESMSWCVVRMLKQVVQTALIPLHYAGSLVVAMYSLIAKAIAAIRGFISRLRSAIASIAGEVYGRLLSVLVQLQVLFMNLKDMFSKSGGILGTTLWMLMGGFALIISAILFVLKGVLGLILALAVIIYVLYALTGIPFIGSIFLAPLLTNIAIFIIIFLIFLIMVEIVHGAGELFGTPPDPDVPGPVGKPGSPPSVEPACFDANTPVQLLDDAWMPMHEIVPGDRLADGAIVTACVRSDASPFYDDLWHLGGTIVTGNHSVRGPEDLWIPAREHPCAIKAQRDSLSNGFVYCLNTSSKSLKIGGLVFGDWDDLDDTDLKHLAQRCPKSTTLPADFSPEDIHAHLETGFGGNTPIELATGEVIPLDRIEIGERLACGATVTGLVRVLSEGVLCLRHVEANTGEMFTAACPRCSRAGALGKGTASDSHLLHLITDTKEFSAGGHRVGHYSWGIERFLDEPQQKKKVSQASGHPGATKLFI